MAQQQGETEKGESGDHTGAESRASDQSAVPDGFRIHQPKQAQDPKSSAYFDRSLYQYVAPRHNIVVEHAGADDTGLRPVECLAVRHRQRPGRNGLDRTATGTSRLRDPDRGRTQKTAERTVIWEDSANFTIIP